MTKPLFIGINPTKAQYRKGCAFYRLQDWLEEMGLGIVAFSNLSHDPYWDKRTIDDTYVRANVGEHTKVVALGGMVSKHLKRLDIEHFTLPHPSPLNRQTNDPEFISNQLKKCAFYLK